MKYLKRILSLALCLVIGCAMVFISGCGAGISYTRIDKVPTREKVTVELQIHEPKNLQTAKGVILMIPGGTGEVGRINFIGSMINNFTDRGYIVGCMDKPSDLGWTGMSIMFRWSFNHQQDIKKTIDYLKNRYQQKPLYLLGFSNGAFSVRHYHLFNDNVSDIAGLIMMSGGFQRMFDLGVENNYVDMPYPVLQVFHANDCYYGGQCEYSSVERYHGILNAKDRKGLITVVGNDSSESAHSFADKKYQVAEAIVDWIEGKNGADAKDFKKTIN